MSSASKVTDHDEIREWTEERGGSPAMVEGTDDDGPAGGLLRLDFGRDDNRLRVIDWDEWFQVFEQSKLALLIDEESDDSRFNKLVSRD